MNTNTQTLAVKLGKHTKRAKTSRGLPFWDGKNNAKKLDRKGQEWQRSKWAFPSGHCKSVWCTLDSINSPLGKIRNNSGPLGLSGTKIASCLHPRTTITHATAAGNRSQHFPPQLEVEPGHRRTAPFFTLKKSRWDSLKFPHQDNTNTYVHTAFTWAHH